MSDFISREISIFSDPYLQAHDVFINLVHPNPKRFNDGMQRFGDYIDFSSVINNVPRVQLLARLSTVIASFRKINLLLKRFPSRLRCCAEIRCRIKQQWSPSGLSCLPSLLTFKAINKMFRIQSFQLNMGIIGGLFASYEQIYKNMNSNGHLLMVTVRTHLNMKNTLLNAHIQR